MAVVDLRPLPVARDPARRLPQLLAGLVLYGASMAMQLRATLGLNPWDVLHEGLAEHIPLSFGTITAITGVVVLLLWIPLRQRPGVGTVANVIVIAFAVDIALVLLPAPDALAGRIALMVGGIVLNGVASAAYIGARLGPGPRDGLMTGARGPHRLVAAPGAHRDRDHRARDGLVARWHRRDRHGALRAGHRPAHAGLSAVPRGARASVSDRGAGSSGTAVTSTGGCAGPSMSASCHGRTTRDEHDQCQHEPARDDGAHRHGVVAEHADHRGDQGADAELDGAEQCRGGARGLAVPGERERGGVGQRETGSEQHEPQRHQDADEAACPDELPS